jgi:coproporphyrinogen III oxidase-like Fe-S oxidoreductase
MNNQNKRYFGDWVLYNNHSDAGYYLGAKLIQFICKYIDFNEVISFSIDEVKHYYQSLIEN